MYIIVPCAGQSSRFPGMRPKYLLMDYSGRLMVERAILPYLENPNVQGIIITVLQKHLEEYNAMRFLENALPVYLRSGKVQICCLQEPTSGPAETVRKTIQQCDLPTDVGLLVKDCDSFFQSPLTPNINAVAVASLRHYPKTRNPAAKSYMMANDQSLIVATAEKKIISDHFSVGGYQFASIDAYVKAYDRFIQTALSEPFVSHVIEYMMANGHVFRTVEVTNYIDVGTAEEWFDYNNKPTYFCDIDGTIVMSKVDYTDPPAPIQENIDVLLQELQRGCKVVFCTARAPRYRAITRKMLDDFGFQDCDLIMGVHHSKRVLVNDFAASNPYPTAEALNIPRNSNQLKSLIH